MLPKKIREALCAICRAICEEQAPAQEVKAQEDTNPTPRGAEIPEEDSTAPLPETPTRSAEKPKKATKVFLDPGHHAGIIANVSPDGSYYEWEGNWNFAQRLKALFEVEGYPVVLTIEDPKSYAQPKEERADFIRRAMVMMSDEAEEQKVFLSIHSNASSDSDGDGWGEGHGMEMFVRSKGEAEGSKEFARALLYGLIEKVPGLIDRTKGKGYKEGNYAVLRHTNPLPAVLLEIDFHDHRKGLARLKDAEYMERFAQGVLLGVNTLNAIYEERRLLKT